MELWLIWLVLAVTLGAVEIFTLTAALGMLGAAALVPAGLAVLGVPLPVQILAFGVATTLGLVLVRPVALRHMRLPAPERFGVDALVGRQAHVLREVTDRDGLVRIDGEEWTARAFDESSVVPVGAAVDILRINGTTAYVHPRE